MLGYRFNIITTDLKRAVRNEIVYFVTCKDDYLQIQYPRCLQKIARQADIIAELVFMAGARNMRLSEARFL